MSSAPPSLAPVRAPFRRRGHIALSLLAALVVVALVPLAMMSWKLIEINREALTAKHQEAQLQVAKSISKEIDAQVEGLSSQLLRVAQTLGVAVRRGRDASREEIQGVLLDVTDERMPALRYSKFGPEGVESITAGEMPAAVQPHFEELLGRALEVHAERKGESWTLLSKPLVLPSAGRRAVLLAAAPVGSRAAFRGVLWGVIDLSAVWNSVANSCSLSVPYCYPGYVVFALDEEGSLLASGSLDGQGPGPEVRHSPLVQSFLRAKEGARETMPFALWQEGREQRYMGAFVKTSQGWGIFVQAREENVFEPIRMMVAQTVRWAIIALLLACLVGIFFARSLSEPINRLAAASREFARGRLSTRVDVRSRNEIGELAHTFNGMAADIADYIRQLKQALAEKEELFMDTIRALAQAIDAKDPYTRGHSDRVTRYAVILAQELGLPKASVDDLRVSAQLHDVGKIGINDAILQKPGALTAEEFEIMKSHAVKGAAIMEPIRQMKNVIPGLRWHHERVDGRGYPDGLTRDEIPRMARIIAVADTFDALTSKRPYRDSWERHSSLDQIDRGVEKGLFDPKIVQALHKFMD